MKRLALLLALMLALACNGGHPLPGENTALPGSPWPGSARQPRNVGTQVWLVPVPAGDMLEMGRHPELWPKAQQRIDVVALYFLHAYHHNGYECGIYCGPNTYHNFLDAVPGGMYRWLSERFDVALEGPSVKEYSCTLDELRKVAESTNIAIRNIKSNGGRLTYLSVDEPFTAGLSRPGSPEFGCGLSVREVAELQREFNDIVHAEHPEVQIGLIEPYLHGDPEKTMSIVTELEAVGVNIGYFHLDAHLWSTVSQHDDVVEDFRKLRNFFRDKNIPFGVLLWGADGSSNEAFAKETWAMARMVSATVGVTEHTVSQSWTESDRSDPNSPKIYPDTVPEDDPNTHTGLLLLILEFLRISPVQ